MRTEKQGIKNGEFPNKGVKMDKTRF